MLELYAKAMSLLGRKNSDSDSNGKTSLKSLKTEQRQVVELLNREFRVVENGLDPAEVMAFLETIAGSSEAAVRRLTHFASLQRFSETMEGMAEEARQVSGHIKEQVRQEAEAEKAQVVEEAKRRAEEIVDQAEKSCIAFIESTNSVLTEAKGKTEEMVDQTKKTCIACVEGTNSVLVEAAVKARQIEDMAFQKIKEMVDMSTEMMQQNIHSLVDSIHSDLGSVFERFTKDLSTSQVEAVHTLSDAIEPGTVPVTEHISEVTKVEESDKIVDSAQESQLIGVGIEGEKAPLNVEAHSVAPKNSSPSLYSGEVTLTIPQPVEASWMSQLRQRLGNSPGVHILLQAGSDTGGSIMNLSLDEPIALSSILLEMPNVERVLEENHKVEASVGGLPKTLTYRLPKELQQTIPEELQQTTLVVVLGEDGNSDPSAHPTSVA